ncbi:MAG: 1-acyl-sn-glycerol-3-phosphate acyltransferase [Candidatus Anammoximicrobium sp.]|nr:1-acyl-sn-glycerol-3-phosphate acyltransferase [Candidatus Anammoximicrobium sp.]
MPHDLAATGFLALLAVAAMAYALRWCWRSPYGGWHAFLYFITLLLTRVLWRTVVPPFPLPPGRGAVIVCNHRSSVDPFFIQIVANRYVRWMVAREYCEHPALAWFLRAARAIPTNRAGVDTAATKIAIRSASEGELIGMFPEGRINRTDQLLLPGRPGAILVALKARVPLLPCFVEGSPYGGSVFSPLLTPARVRVRFGEPIDLSAYYGREQEAGVLGQLCQETLSAIAHLAGRDDFQPKLAGRKWNQA